MKKANKLIMILLCISSLLFVSCAQNLSGTDYSSNQVQNSARVLYGTVVDLKQIHISSEDNNKIVGTAAGAIVGGVIGSMFGGGKGGTLATIGGALGGAALGNQLEKGATGQPGQEITVRLDNGEHMVIVQGLGPNTININQKVKVLISNDGKARVS